MKKILPLGIDAYEFDELSESAREKAINDEIQFWIDCVPYDENNKGNFERAIDESERMQTPWFVGSYIYEYCKGEILNSCREYLYDEDGEIVPLFTKYAEGEQPKTMFRTFGTHSVEVTLV